MRTSTRLSIVAGAIFVLADGVAAEQRASSNPESKVSYGRVTRIASTDGGDNFQHYCASCHGQDAKGSGPAAAALTVAPADLTTIAQRHGGTFPAAHVRESICGNHGEPLRGMPDWQPVLRSISRSDGELQIRLNNLVRYLESIQQM